MRVAVFYPTSIRNHNPFDTAERSVFEYLATQYGWNITLFVDKGNKYRYGGEALMIKEIERLPFALQIPIMILHRIGAPLPVPAYPTVLLKKALKDYDVVLSENPWCPTALYPYLQAKQYIMIDSMVLDQKVDKRVSALLKRARGVICLTGPVAEKYRCMGPLFDSEMVKTIVVGGHPVDSGLFSPPDCYPEDTLVRIVSTGRLVSEKGFHIIIDALGDCVRRHQNIQLEIIGEGGSRTDLKNMVKKARLKEHVLFSGSFSSAEIANKYKSAHIFVNHSMETATSREAFGVINIEAMSSGLPVITTDCGAIPWVVRDKAIIVKQGDVSSLAREMENLILDRNKRMMMGAAGREFVRSTYTVEIIGERYYQAICDLTGL